MACRELNIVGLLVKRGATQRGDEPVSGLDHALQCAAPARAPDEVVLAALLHDVGHLLSASEETPFTHHGLWAARFLRPFVSPRVAWLVEYHATAIRSRPASVASRGRPRVRISPRARIARAGQVKSGRGRRPARRATSRPWPTLPDRAGSRRSPRW
jgi:HD domain-containing protein